MAEIAWRGSLAAALADSRREGRPVFVDFWLRT